MGQYRIQMKQDGNWVTLGGVFQQAEADERLHQFMNCYMRRSEPMKKDSSLICGREFRTMKAE